MLTLALGCFLLAVAAVRWWDDRPGAAWSRDIPAIVDRLAELADRSTGSSSALSPLVAQAQAFADHLNPPGSSESSPGLQDPPANEVPQAAVAPATTLTLHATSCYPEQPSRSMALVSTAGQTREQRWVKEGSQFGSFHIHEIRRGGILYREGDLLHEVAIEARIERPSLVRDTRIGSRQVSAAIDDLIRSRPGVAGPNDIETTGN
jgi:hypothetical protein